MCTIGTPGSAGMDLAAIFLPSHPSSFKLKLAFGCKPVAYKLKLRCSADVQPNMQEKVTLSC